MTVVCKSERNDMQPNSITGSQIIAAMLLPPILVLLCVLYVAVVLFQGRPFLYVSERMRDAETSFRLYKIRTLRPAKDAVETVLGGAQRDRVTALGLFLRRSRLDELPQIFNVLKGDIGFIGPRPPLRAHVAACPSDFALVLRAVRPGITGLSTVMVHRREERLLSRCRTAEEAEQVYLTLCLPLKLRLEMLYADRRGFLLDVRILWQTFSRLAPHRRRPAKRLVPTIPKPAGGLNATA